MKRLIFTAISSYVLLYTDIMSLQHLRLARLPVYGQLTSAGSTEASPSQNLAQDNRDVLIERLNELINFLSRGDDLEERAMVEIHSKVDQIEEVIRGKEEFPDSFKSPKSPQILRNIVNPGAPRSVEDVSREGPKTARRMSMRLANVSAQRAQHISPSKAIQIANEAENLAAEYGFSHVDSVCKLLSFKINPANYCLLVWRKLSSNFVEEEKKLM